MSKKNGLNFSSFLKDFAKDKSGNIRTFATSGTCSPLADGPVQGDLAVKCLGTESTETDLQLKFEGVDTNNNNKASSKSIPTENAGSELDEDEGMTEQWEKGNNFGSLSTLSSFAPKLPGVYSDSSIEYEFTHHQAQFNFI
ncbi:MAG: hypothetical protein LBP35_06865 [Candidatus Ancillula trichonymphae]|nr:hypothetical protein [Candidatus Ancillula trichonymphae]